MSTSNPTLSPAVLETINQVSGTYTAPFVDGLFSVTESLETLQEFKGAIDALHNCGKSAEAYHLILALHDLAAIEIPQAILELQPYPEGIEQFISEFLLDMEDLLLDYESEAQGANG